VSAFADLGTTAPQRVWDGVLARTVHGDRVTLTLVELDAGATVPEHSHDNEQLGLLLRGSLQFTVGDETRDLGPGQTWCIGSRVPHSVVAGPDGAVAAEVFAPMRDDWKALPIEEARPGRWPSA
jgi:quercetin dioxygenase-like cupin family protein